MTKKIKAIAFTIYMLVFVLLLHAQTDVQNNGILSISNSPGIFYVSGNFSNNSTASFTNNGNLYVKQGLSNAQAGLVAGSGTLYLNGTSLQSVGGTQAFNTFNLVTNNAAGIVLNNNLSVAGVHTFTTGMVTTSSLPNYLIYETGASYTGDTDTRHVNGWVRKAGNTDFIFPVGNGTVERTAGISGLSAAVVFNARYAAPTANTGNILTPLFAVSPNEYWTIDRVSGGNAKIDLNWNNSKTPIPVYVLGDIRVANYQAGYWTALAGVAAGNPANTGSISTSDISSFGAFTIGSITAALPVTILQFGAHTSNGIVLVDWTTSDEINVSHYDILRSDDGIRFYSIGTAPARNTTGLQQYQLTDAAQLINSPTYYRLHSIDKDGTVKISKVVAVRSGSAGSNYVVVVNPVHQSIQLNMQGITGSFNYRILSASGATVQQGQLNVPVQGWYNIRLLPAVKASVCVLQIEKPGFSFSQKLFIK